MSVWNYGVTKVKLAKSIYQLNKHLFTRCMPSSPSMFFDLSDTVFDMDDSTTWDGVADDLNWVEGDIDLSEVYSDPMNLDLVTVWNIGTSAVYSFVEMSRRGHFGCSGKFPRENIAASLEVLGALMMPGTQITPAAFNSAFSTCNERYADIAWTFYEFSEGVKIMRSQMPATGRDPVEINQRKCFGEGSRLAYGFLTPELVIMKGSSSYSEHGFILNRTHLSILIEVLGRLANLYWYLAYTGKQRAKLNARIHEMTELTITTAYAKRNKYPDKIVKAFHKVRAMAQMRMFENESDSAEVGEMADYVQDRLDGVIDPSNIFRLLDGIKKGYWLEILQVYKWMPPPDFDNLRCFSELKTWHMATRSSGLDIDATREARELWKLVELERKVNLAAAYKRAHGKYPESLMGEQTKPTEAMFNAWEPTSIYPYHQYGTDFTSQIKDKSIPAATIEEEFTGKKSLSEKSFLLWYMDNAGRFDTVSALNDIAGIGEDNFAKVALKFESHKANGRAFFMAPPKRRILLGELEGNLSSIAKDYPASLQGRSAREKAIILDDLMNPYEDPGGVSENLIYTVFILMFDCTKWSPKSNGNVTRNYHEFWAKVFGVNAIADLYTFGPESDIVFNQDGFKAKYRNQGADLEGFRGRMMTMFHADMLAAAVRLANKRNCVTGKGVLTVFIDDGAVKVAVVGEGQEATDNVNLFLAAMRDIYAACGQDNHPSKTCISKVGAEMLSTQYLHGYKMSTSTKTVMKIIPDSDQPAISLPEELDSIYSSTQGLVKDGGDWIVSYKIYLQACLISIARWSSGRARHYDPEKMAFKCVTPKSFGGFGIRSLQSVVTSSAVNLTAEGLGNLNRVARYYPGRSLRVKEIVTKPVVKRPNLAMLRDPTRIRTAAPVMAENRLMMRIIRWFDDPGKSLAKFMKGYKHEDLISHATAVADALFAKPTVSVTVAERAWKCTPLYHVEMVVSKFKRAATVISMLGYREIGNIRKANLKDVQKILDD